MIGLRHRRDRRPRGPFAAAPRPEAPRRSPEQPPPAYDSRMDVDSALARIAALAQAEAEQARPAPSAAPWGPWDQPGSFPAAMEPDALRDEHGRWYGWDTTVMDNPPAHARPYAARRRTPDVAADLASLPVFRDAVARRTRHQAGECLCGSPVTGQAWGERMVRAGMHLTGNEAAA